MFFAELHCDIHITFLLDNILFQNFDKYRYISKYKCMHYILYMRLRILNFYQMFLKTNPAMAATFYSMKKMANAKKYGRILYNNILVVSYGHTYVMYITHVFKITIINQDELLN